MSDWNKQPPGVIALAKLADLVATVRRIELLAKLVRARRMMEMQAKIAQERASKQ